MDTKNPLRAEYIARINRVIDYIENHLADDLSLARLAEVAHFSRFHFHRIFRAFVGETLSQFIQRVRLEKAATQLLHQPKKTITDIAFDCGFSGPPAFARAFRELFGMSASAWRAGGYTAYSKMRKADGNPGETPGKMREAAARSRLYIDPETFNPMWRITMLDQAQIQVTVKDMPPMHVAYVRHIGPYQGDPALFERLFGTLMTWAGPRGLLRFPQTQMLSIYYDNPDITDATKLRLDVGITVPADTQVDGEIGKLTMPAGKVAMARFELGPQEYGEAWDLIYGMWLPESGYQPDDRPCFELYYNDPKEHPEHKHIVDICVPVKPL